MIAFPTRRTALKVLHWSMVPLLIWFILVTPEDVLPFGPRAFQAHSMLALVFVTLCLLWTADYLRRGPRQPPRAQAQGLGASPAPMAAQGADLGAFRRRNHGFPAGSDLGDPSESRRVSSHRPTSWTAPGQ